MFKLMMIMWVATASGIPPSGSLMNSVAAATPVEVGRFNSPGDCTKAAEASRAVVAQSGNAVTGTSFACVKFQ